MKLSLKAKNLLIRVGRREDNSILLTILTRQNRKAAAELVAAELATTIPVSTGGAHLCLTRKGIDEYERRSPQNA